MAEMYKTSIVYRILRVYTNIIYKKWYSRVEVNGEGVIPERGSVIFAPCHQNAFIDAMALLWASPRPIVFLAKAGIFTKKWIKKALFGLKIMPAYRMRDGFSNLKKNEESFEEAVKVLSHDEFFCLMPEGGQDEKRFLRPLVKGIFRIAFAAQKIKPEGESVLIIPTGIDYGHYDRSGSHLVLNFGKPIKIADYMQSYIENDAVTLNHIREDLYNRIKPLMHHVESANYYEAHYVSSYIYQSALIDELDWEDNETNRLECRQRITDALCSVEEHNEEKMKKLSEYVSQFLSKGNDIENYTLAAEEGESYGKGFWTQLVYVIFTLPLFLFSFVFNGLPWLFFKYISDKAKGSGFEGSIMLGLTYITLPFFYLIYSLLLFFLTDIWSNHWLFLALVVSMPLSMDFMVRYIWRCRYLNAKIENKKWRYRIYTQIKDLVDSMIGGSEILKKRR